MPDAPVITNKTAATVSQTTATSTTGPLVPPGGAPLRITAKPLVSPDFNNVRAKNPMITVRWVNRTYENGYRVDYHNAQGFEIARPDEVCMTDGRPIPASMVKDGKVCYGDVILMKLARELYEGDLLYDHNRAVQRVQRFGAIEHTTIDENGNVSEVTIPDVVAAHTAGAPPAQRAKIRSFVPSAAQLNAIMGPDTGANK